MIHAARYFSKSFEILPSANDIESSLLLSNSMTVLIRYRVGVFLIVRLSNLV